MGIALGLLSLNFLLLANDLKELEMALKPLQC